MDTALQAFTNHEFGTIRTITSGGQILFCGKDVATALGYANTKDALVRLVSSKLPAAEQALLGAVIAQAEEFGHVLYLGKTIG